MNTFSMTIGIVNDIMIVDVKNDDTHHRYEITCNAVSLYCVTDNGCNLIVTHEVAYNEIDGEMVYVYSMYDNTIENLREDHGWGFSKFYYEYTLKYK